MAMSISSAARSGSPVIRVGAGEPDEAEDAVADPIDIAQGDRATDVALGLGRVPGVVP
ncbi:hypothetical protein [Amycolatopsis sp. NPDC004625]|uniref:hypothetical protein n=1 Tax=Amycolatopsis sp. NPDC004625 TaxID=3154670 RepID=UPI0033BF4611